MTVEELTEVIKNSGLLHCEIAKAVTDAIKEDMEKYFNSSAMEDLVNNNDYISFYLAARRFGD